MAMKLLVERSPRARRLAGSELEHPAVGAPDLEGQAEQPFKALAQVLQRPDRGPTPRRAQACFPLEATSSALSARYTYQAPTET
jgi:hypothetical protein